MKEVTVRIAMTVLVEEESEAADVAQRWFPYQRELPLGCSDGAQLIRVEITTPPRVVICPTKMPEEHQLGEFPMSCYRCHMEADS